jgi:excisionase family DNA binding protein
VQRNTPDRLADTVDEFCARVGISRRHFYALLRRGEGPPTVTVGRRRLIRRAAGEAWLLRQETRMT